jgi:ubiquinone/menaquinone biosynthesis C-methylase UbiE
MSANRFDREASAWDQEPLRVKLAEDISRSMIESLRPNPTQDVLELGCGTGLVTLQFQPLVHSILAVDSSAGMLAELGKKLAAQGCTNVSTRCLDAEKGDRLEGSFHIALSSMTLHHVRDVPGLLAGLFGVLRPGGRLAIADLDSEDGHFHSNPEGVAHHGFDRTALRRLIESAGFTSVQDRLVAETVKPVAGGAPRAFSVFLITGTRPE